MLKPMYQSSLPPRAIWPNVVPKALPMLIWKLWPPARFSTPKLDLVFARLVAG